MATIPITSLTSATAPPAAHSIRGIVTLSWPYSSSTRQCALLLADPDFRLRNRRGQVRVRFTGASAEAVAKSHIGIGDEVILGLDGASWEKDVEATRTPGKSVDGELLYTRRLSLKVVKAEGDVGVSVDAPVSPTRSPNQPDAAATPLPKAKKRLYSSLDGTMESLSSYIYSSPAFVKRLRLLNESFLDSTYDPFSATGSDDELVEKRQRTSFGSNLNWRYAERSPSPVKSTFEERLASPPQDAIVNSPQENGTQFSGVDVEDSTEMPPPPLRRLEVPVTDSVSDRAQEEDQHEGPRTPKLQPVKSPTLPLPSPFPTETAQAQLATFGTHHPSQHQRQEAPDVDREPTDKHQPSLSDGTPEESELILDRNMAIAGTQLQGYPSDTEPDEEADELVSVQLDESLGDTDDGEDEVLDDPADFVHEDDVEVVIEADDLHPPNDGDDGGIALEAEPTPRVSVEAEGFLRQSTNFRAHQLEKAVVEQPRTPTKDAIREPQSIFGLDGATPAAPSVQVTPQSEKERVMAQTYRSLFGFRRSPGVAAPPQQQAVQPVQSVPPTPDAGLADMSPDRAETISTPAEDDIELTVHESGDKTVPVTEMSAADAESQPSSPTALASEPEAPTASEELSTMARSRLQNAGIPTEEPATTFDAPAAAALATKPEAPTAGEESSAMARSGLQTSGISSTEEPTVTVSAPAETRPSTGESAVSNATRKTSQPPQSSARPSTAVVDLGSSSEEEDTEEEEVEGAMSEAGFEEGGVKSEKEQLPTSVNWPLLHSPEIQDSLEDSETEDLLNTTPRPNHAARDETPVHGELAESLIVAKQRPNVDVIPEAIGIEDADILATDEALDVEGSTDLNRELTAEATESPDRQPSPSVSEAREVATLTPSPTAYSPVVDAEPLTESQDPDVAVPPKSSAPTTVIDLGSSSPIEQSDTAEVPEENAVSGVNEEGCGLERETVTPSAYAAPPERSVEADQTSLTPSVGLASGSDSGDRQERVSEPATPAGLAKDRPYEISHAAPELDHVTASSTAEHRLDEPSAEAQVKSPTRPADVASSPVPSESLEVSSQQPQQDMQELQVSEASQMSAASQVPEASQVVEASQVAEASQVSEALQVSEASQVPMYPSLPLSPSNSQALQDMPSQIVTESHKPEAISSVLPPTPQLTQKESSIQQQDTPEVDLPASQSVSSETPAGRLEPVAEHSMDSTAYKTPAKKPLSTRLSNVPDVISAWFSPKRSNGARTEDVHPTRNTTGKVRQDSEHQQSDMPQVNDNQQVQVNGDRRLRDVYSPTGQSQTNGLSTSLSYFTPLSKLDSLLNSSSQQSFGSNALDVFGVVTAPTKEPERAKAGPRDYITIFRIADTSISAHNGVRVEVFRPWKATLPIALAGDVILLRGFTVKSRKRQAYLLSTDTSAWCVWRYESTSAADDEQSKPIWAHRRSSSSGNAVREEMKGPPVELGEEERKHAAYLHQWWQALKGQEQPQESITDSNDEGEQSSNGYTTSALTAKL